MKKVALIVTGLLIATPMASADPGQFGDDTLDFGLTDQDAGPLLPDELVMRAEKTGEGGTVPIVAGESVTWVAENPAEVDLNIDEQNVTVHLRFTALTSIENVTVTYGVMDDAGNFDEIGSATESTLAVEEVVEFPIPAEEHNITAGERPAVTLSVNFLDTGTGLAVVETGTSSAVHYELTSPGEEFPTPELGSLALSGMGLLGLLGAARIQRN